MNLFLKAQIILGFLFFSYSCTNTLIESIITGHTMGTTYNVKIIHSKTIKNINQIKYEISNELVSNDIIGNVCASVFDSNATIVSEDGLNCVIYSWYDNEYGYTKQVIRVAKYISKVRRLIYY